MPIGFYRGSGDNWRIGVFVTMTTKADILLLGEKEGATRAVPNDDLVVYYWGATDGQSDGILAS